MNAKENRKFGLTLAAAAAAILVVRGLRHRTLPPGLLGACAILLLLSSFLPGWLERPRRVWVALGDILGHVTHPIVLAVVYFGVIAPTGALRRRFGRSKVDLPAPGGSWKRGRASYWVPVEPRGQRASWESLRRQF